MLVAVREHNETAQLWTRGTFGWNTNCSPLVKRETSKHSIHEARSHVIFILFFNLLQNFKQGIVAACQLRRNTWKPPDYTIRWSWKEIELEVRKVTQSSHSLDRLVVVVLTETAGGLRPPSYNLGQMEQQTPIPRKLRIKPHKKRAIFPSLIWRGGGYKFPVYFVQDCRLAF